VLGTAFLRKSSTKGDVRIDTGGAQWPLSDVARRTAIKDAGAIVRDQARIDGSIRRLRPTVRSHKRVSRDWLRKLQNCYGLLVRLQSGRAQRILSIQPRLVEVLFEIALVDAVLTRRQKYLIRSGRRSDPAFRPTMAKLAAQRKYLREIQGIARYIGDSFAWFFFQFDPGLLRRHARRPRVARMPSGAGGQAELQMARHLQSLNGCLVLHHAATSSLRLGDVSLWSPTTRRIVGIGEIKSGTPVGSKMEVNVEFIFRADGSVVSASERGELAAKPFPVHDEKRRKRQMRDITKAVVDTATTSPARQNARVDSLCDELTMSVIRAREGGLEFVDLGPGLFVLLCRGNVSDVNAAFDSGSDAFEAHVRKIAYPNSPFNALSIGSVLYAEDGRPVSTPDTVPFLWLGMDAAALADLVFHRVTAFTIFNPAHMLEALKARGFEIAPSARPFQFQVTKKRSDRRVGLEGFDYFLRLRAHSLCEHESLVELIDTLARTSEELLGEGGGRVQLELNQRAGRPP